MRFAPSVLAELMTLGANLGPEFHVAVHLGPPGAQWWGPPIIAADQTVPLRATLLLRRFDLLALHFCSAVNTIATHTDFALDTPMAAGHDWFDSDGANQ